MHGTSLWMGMLVFVDMCPRSTTFHNDLPQENLRVLLQMNDNDIGVDTTHISTILMDPELKASQCLVGSLKQYSIAVKGWIWPGLLDFEGLDGALHELIQCAFEKAKIVSHLFLIRTQRDDHNL